MAYSELIKNFEKIRAYMRDFYIYGFRTRMDYDMRSASEGTGNRSERAGSGGERAGSRGKHADSGNGRSARSYDDERRRVESWLGDAMAFRQDSAGKRVFISVDNRETLHNPLYRAFKAKSFTDKDITLHFYILDILADGEALTVREMADRIAERIQRVSQADFQVDDSTVRNKLKEYTALGILAEEKRGREKIYRRQESRWDRDGWRDAVAFASETMPLGVVGSYLLDKYRALPDYFSFKHHYLMQALDAEILETILEARRTRRSMRISFVGRHRGERRDAVLFPLKVYISTQDGRQYLMGYSFQLRRPRMLRMDRIREVEILDALADKTARAETVRTETTRTETVRTETTRTETVRTETTRTETVRTETVRAKAAESATGPADKPREAKAQPQQLELSCEAMDHAGRRFAEHLWGASAGAGRNRALAHLEMIIRVREGEDFIFQRLVREKRTGTVEQVDEGIWRFTADVYDAQELLPWIRTFTGRIVSLSCTDPEVETRFYADLREMCSMYGQSDPPDKGMNSTAASEASGAPEASDASASFAAVDGAGGNDEEEKGGGHGLS